MIRREDGAKRSIMWNISVPIAARLGAGRLGPGSRLLAHWGTGRFVAPAGAGCALARSAVNLTLVKAAVKQKLGCRKISPRAGQCRAHRHVSECKIWYSISQTVSDLGNIHDRSVRAFAVKPRAFGAPLSGFGANRSARSSKLLPVPRCPPDNRVHSFADNV